MTTIEEVFHPRSIAVIGASGNPVRIGYHYVRWTVDYGFKGKVYPVNPNPEYKEILGFPVYPSLSKVPANVDYVISCLPAAAVPALLEECALKRVKVLHLYTGRFSETGHVDAIELENDVIARAKKLGVRIIGPNCMGVYNPGVGMSIAYDLPREAGNIGFISQTGGGASVFVQQAGLRGLRFSKVVSYGNAIDYDESDFLEYLTCDPETTIIAVYIEGAKDGRRFLQNLKAAAAAKPTVVIKGGRGISGGRTARSHTASLAGSTKIWQEAVRQTGAVMAGTLDDLVDIVTAFYYLPAIKGVRTGVLGGSGGESILSADQCEEAGLEVPPLGPEIRAELKKRAPFLWDWLGNPVDMSILEGPPFEAQQMLEIMSQSARFDLIIANVGEGGPRPAEDATARLLRIIDGYTRVVHQRQKPLLVALRERSISLETWDDWRWKAVCTLRSRLIAAGIPIFPTVGRAAMAARKLVDYYTGRKR